jgi:DNA-binding PadR family transcriptional regulator
MPPIGHIPARELKKGSAELLVLALVEDQPGGALRFNVASLYPLLYRLEKRGWIEGRWMERAGQRRRRLYRLTPDGRRVLAAQRGGWLAFARAVSRIAGVEI